MGRTVSTRLSICVFVDGRATVHTSDTALKLGRHPNRFVLIAELCIEGTSTPRHLLQRIAGGDKEAFHALYRRYGPRVTALVRRRIDEREVVEELVQDVFVAAWQTARSYRSDLGDPEHWLLGITRHKLQDHWRRLGRIARTAGLPWRESAIEAPEFHPEVRLSIAKAVGTLSAEQRRVIDLMYGYGLTCAEAARALGVPTGTVKSRANAALKKMKAFLSAETSP